MKQSNMVDQSVMVSKDKVRVAYGADFNRELV